MCSFIAVVSLKSRSLQGVELVGLAFVLSSMAVAGEAAAAAAASAAAADRVILPPFPILESRYQVILQQLCSHPPPPPAVCSLIFTGIQRRHLMVWRIFAPKFVFSVSLAGAAVAGWLVSVARVLASGSAGQLMDDRRRE